MNFKELAKQLIEFREALQEQTDDDGFINAMCGQYMMNYIACMISSNMKG